MSEKIQAIRGMNDVLPDEAGLWEFFEDTVRDWLRGYGYRGIRTPILERTDLFNRAIGEVTDIVEKEMYTFVDELNGESLTLRPEGTASCVRAVIAAQPALRRRRSACGTWGRCSVTNARKRGVTASFTRSAWRHWASAGPDIDAEQIVMCARLWRKLGLDGMPLELNTLGSAEARARYRQRLVQYLEPHLELLDEDSRAPAAHQSTARAGQQEPGGAGVIEAAPQIAG